MSSRNEIPNNISKNTVKVYHVRDIKLKTTKRIISVNLYQWSSNIPKTLKELSIQTICDNWKKKPLINELPLLSDVMTLLDILPTDLPLHLSVANIAYDCYWLRCYKKRWPERPPLGRNFSEVEKLERETEKKYVEELSPTLSTIDTPDNKGIAQMSGDEDDQNSNLLSLTKSIDIDTCPITFSGQSNVEKNWKELYLEMHIQEYLENLDPENYDPEKIKEIISLCKNYVTTLNLKEIRAPTKTDVPDHIPLNSILSGLSKLTELCICFKQTYVGEKFSWHIFNTTMADIKTLAKGLESAKLRVLRIQNSDINCAKVKMILKKLNKNEHLREIEFSHCKISDHGTMAMAKFIQEHPNVHILVLTNNFIGSNGAKSLAYLLTDVRNCKMIKLDIRLNMIRPKGGQYLNRSLIIGGKYLKNLNIAGCGLTENNKEIEEMLLYNTTLKQLDVSNNRMGEEIGKAMVKGLRYNKSVIDLDVRRCNFSSDIEWEILKITKGNRFNEVFKIPQLPTKDVQENIRSLFSDGFIDEFNKILDD